MTLTFSSYCFIGHQEKDWVLIFKWKSGMGRLLISLEKKKSLVAESAAKYLDSMFSQAATHCPMYLG